MSARTGVGAVGCAIAALIGVPLIVSSNLAGAQVVVSTIDCRVPPPATPTPPPTPAEVFLEGGWITNNNSKTAPIVVALPKGTGPLLLRICSNEFVDRIDADHLVRTDRGEALGLSEISSALVEGSAVELVQQGNGSVLSGRWEAVAQPAPTGRFAKSNWLAVPNRPSLIADFAAPRLLVLSFNDHPECKDVRLKVVVDGKALTYRGGGEINMLQRTGLVAAGSKVVVTALGACSPTNFRHFSGSLKISEPVERP